jgi:nucleotide-binding universal stress UspA family protein
MSAVAQVTDQKHSLRIARILMATDFSQASQVALAHGLALAHRYGSELSVLHAVAARPRPPIPMEILPSDLDRSEMEAEEHMQKLRESGQFTNLQCRFLLPQGAPWEAISSALAQYHADLLVLGTHGRRGAGKLVLGSVAEKILHRAPCPVLTLGPSVVADSKKPEYRQILFATDFGPGSSRAFDYALSLAIDYRARLILLHLMPLVPGVELGPIGFAPPVFGAEALMTWRAQTREESLQRLRGLIPSGANLAVEPEFIVQTDFAREGILNIAEANCVDLIVMGAKRASSTLVAERTPWSHTHQVICQAACPVLTVSQ